MASHHQKSHVAPHFDHKECNGAINDTVGIMCCQHHWYHMTKKGHVAPYFDFLDLRNVMIPLMMLPELLSPGTGVNGFT